MSQGLVAIKELNEEELPASSEQIANQVNKIIKSELFSSSPKLIAFLKYIVTQTIAGRADRLKQFSIATKAIL